LLDTQSRPRSSNGAPLDHDPNVTDGPVSGGPSVRPRLPQDRSHLLRRSSRPVFHLEDQETEGTIRIRRERRVNAPFSAIPALARNGGR
jgi:hypothetical protein